MSDDKDLGERLVKRSEDRKARQAVISEERKHTRERIREFRDRWANNALPDLPRDMIPGYHLCWGTTQSKMDTLESRVALGYELVKHSELPKEFHNLVGKVTSGQFEGVVNCNEMVLLKMPMELYQEVMTMLHHEDPLEHQMNITTAIREKAEEMRGSFSLDEGYLDMEKAVSRAMNPNRFST